MGTNLHKWLMVGIWLTLGASCAVTSKEVREEARPPVPFDQLLADPAAHRGRTVILGGYILEVRNAQDVTTLVLLQSPLGAGESPGPREASEGRFMVRHPGFLDPAVYAKDRRVTVAGTVEGSTREPVEERDYDYPLLSLREIHIWEDETRYVAPYPYPYYDPFYDPWWPYGYPYHRPWRGHPYRW